MNTMTALLGVSIYAYTEAACKVPRHDSPSSEYRFITMEAEGDVRVEVGPQFDLGRAGMKPNYCPEYGPFPSAS